jgi:hypothetical protein
VFHWLRRQPEPPDSPALSLADFEALLRTGETPNVVSAAMQASRLGPVALVVASRVAADPTVPSHGRVWALNAVHFFAASHRQAVCDTACAALADSAPGVRSLAVHIVGDLRCEDAVPRLVNLLGDSAADPSDWSGETTVHDAVLSALQRIGTPQAREAITKAGVSPQCDVSPNPSLQRTPPG